MHKRTRGEILTGARPATNNTKRKHDMDIGPAQGPQDPKLIPTSPGSTRTEPPGDTTAQGAKENTGQRRHKQENTSQSAKIIGAQRI